MRKHAPGGARTRSDRVRSNSLIATATKSALRWIDFSQTYRFHPLKRANDLRTMSA